MKIAYLILAHKNPHQLSRLIRKIASSEDGVYVHIDGSVDVRPFHEACGSRCFFIDQRKKIYWAGFSIVEATLLLMSRACIEDSYDYYCLLSGLDYPIKSLSKLKSFLESNNGSEFINVSDLVNGWPGVAVRYKKYRITESANVVTKIAQKIINLLPFEREMYGGMIPFGGSQWWTLSKACVKYILNKAGSYPSLLQYFKHTRVPDEMFFHTLIMNSPFKEKVSSNNLREIFWLPNSSHPLIINTSDFSRLASSNMFFARKFDENIDSNILSLIDSRLIDDLSVLPDQGVAH